MQAMTDKQIRARVLTLSSKAWHMRRPAAHRERSRLLDEYERRNGAANADAFMDEVDAPTVAR